MRKTFLHPVRNRLIRVAAVAVVGVTCLRAENDAADKYKTSFKAHPQVFGMIQSWISDAASPVVTEINLDAVEKNGNQFSNDGIKQEDGWTVIREADVKGFKRYRVIETKGSHYKVEYQENDGGTLTTSSIIGFTVAKREIHKNGKPVSIRVLRVDSCDSK